LRIQHLEYLIGPYIRIGLYHVKYHIKKLRDFSIENINVLLISQKSKLLQVCFVFCIWCLVLSVWCFVFCVWSEIYDAISLC
jgi:hypothetical protein